MEEQMEEQTDTEKFIKGTFSYPPFYWRIFIGFLGALLVFLFGALVGTLLVKTKVKPLHKRENPIVQTEQERKEERKIINLSDFLQEDENYNPHPPKEPLKQKEKKENPSLQKGLRKALDFKEIQSLNEMIDVEKFIQGNGMIAVVNEKKELLYIIAGASWYGKNFHRRKMANGKRFNQFNPQIAASNALPLGLKVEITNLATGKKIRAEIHDRGPFATDPQGKVLYPLQPRKGKLIDLSRAGAEELGFLKDGLALLKIKPSL